MNTTDLNIKPYIIFLTGASGAGKTALLKALEHQLMPTASIACFYFDSIGVPSEEEMIKSYGSPTEWQKAKIYEWVKKLTTEIENKKLIILEGQVHLDFIQLACKEFNVTHYKIILVHCGLSTRHKRLHQGRNQPELVNDTMDNWSDYLKKQALAKNVPIPILDTTFMTIQEMVASLEKHIAPIVCLDKESDKSTPDSSLLHFEKANVNHKDIIFRWLAEPHMQEFWDNSQEHKDDILNFIYNRKQHYFYGTTCYWIGYLSHRPFCFILSDQVCKEQKDLSALHQKYLSKTGNTITLDFGIGDTTFLGKGLAATALCAFVKFYQETVDPKADTFFIDPDKNNPRAIRVYEKAGFEEKGIFSANAGAFEGHSSYLMVKKL